MSITLLLSLSMFQMLLLELIPPTSITVPMMGKYILFTMAMVSLSVFISVVTVNVSLRSVTTKRMPRWTRVLFFSVLPRLLFMKRPEVEVEIEEEQTYWSVPPDWPDPGGNLTQLQSQSWRQRGSRADDRATLAGYTLSSTFVGADDLWVTANLSHFCQACSSRKLRSSPLQIQKALEGMAFIEGHHREDAEQKTVRIFLSSVHDRPGIRS